MRAHHYVSALEAAQTAGRETPTLAEATRGARCARPASGQPRSTPTGLRRAPSTARSSCPGTMTRSVRSCCSPRRERASTRRRWDIDELTVARDALLAKATWQARRGGTLAARVAWMRGARRRGGREHSERAEGLAAPLPPSAEKADVYAVPGQAALARQPGGRRPTADERGARAGGRARPACDSRSAPEHARHGAGDAGRRERRSTRSRRASRSTRSSAPPTLRARTTTSRTRCYRLGRIREALVTSRSAWPRPRSAIPAASTCSAGRRPGDPAALVAEGRWGQAVELAERRWAETGARRAPLSRAGMAASSGPDPARPRRPRRGGAGRRDGASSGHARQATPRS